MTLYELLKDFPSLYPPCYHKLMLNERYMEVFYDMFFFCYEKILFIENLLNPRAINFLQWCLFEIKMREHLCSVYWMNLQCFYNLLNWSTYEILGTYSTHLHKLGGTQFWKINTQSVWKWKKSISLSQRLFLQKWQPLFNKQTKNTQVVEFLVKLLATCESVDEVKSPLGLIIGHHMSSISY